MASDSDPALVVTAVPLFSDLSPDERQEMAWLVSPFACVRGERIFRQGDPGDTLYCIEQGRIGLTVRMPGGGDVPLCEVGPGQMLGEMALLDAGPRSATATALEPTSGHTVSGLGFNALCAALRPSAFKVLRRLATILTTRLRTQAQGFADGDPVQLDDALANSGAGLRSPAAALDRRNLMLLPALRRLSAEELGELLEQTNALVVPRRHVIVREGDPAGSCFVVVRGAVLVSVKRGSLHRKLAVEGPGAMFGHLALLAPGVRSATCTTRENSILLEIDRKTFEGMFDAASVVAFKFLAAISELLSGELRKADHRIGLVVPVPS